MVLAKRELAHRHLGVWCQLASEDEGERPGTHHALLNRHLEAVERGDISRLMVIMPPGSAKTRYGSILFPCWFMARKPNRKVIMASYAAALAEVNNSKMNAVMEDKGHWLGVKPTSHAASHWKTDNGGESKAAGVDGPITGFRADCMIIDDPVKNETDVDSEAKRDAVFKWYWSAVNTRLKAGKKASAAGGVSTGGAVILIMTRWHQDDLAGRLLAGDRSRWTVLHLRAEAKEGEVDPLGREPGQMLWDDDSEYDYGQILRDAKADLQKNGMMRVWNALYQGDPMPGEGALFDAGKLIIVDAAPAGGRVVRSWDLAATAKVGARNPDWTVGAKMRKFEDRIYIEDVERFRGRPDEVKQRIRKTAMRDGHHVRIALPQDPGQAGVAQVQDLTGMLSGFTVKAVRPTGDKSTRAAPFASQVNVGNVYLVAGPWNAAFIDELASFPAGTFDDQVDAAADGLSALASVGTARVQKLGY
jgi:predicted phage terminase large subunit-like protein